MASEAKLSLSLQINGGNSGQLNFVNQPQSFSANCSTAVAHGSTPGSVLCSINPGTDISLAGLTNPGGWAVIQNMDSTNYVTLGIFDPTNSEFYPMLELLPGEFIIVRLSRILGQDLAGTSVSASNKTFRGLANTAPVYINVQAFNA